MNYTTVETPDELDESSLHQLQHFAELGRLSASLLHEISNPLTAALLQLEQINDQQSPGIERVQHSLNLLRRYVEAARQQLRRESTVSAFCIRPQLEQLQHIVGPLAQNAGIELLIDPAPHCRLYGDPVKLQHILANLIVNAVDAYRVVSSRGADKIVKVHLVHRDQHLAIRVTDWGQGISPAQLPKIFQPFYSTKHQSGCGVGIGLAIVKQHVMDDFGGTIQATSSPRQGTCFTVRLPTAICQGLHASDD